MSFAVEPRPRSQQPTPDEALPLQRRVIERFKFRKTDYRDAARVTEAAGAAAAVHVRTSARWRRCTFPLGVKTIQLNHIKRVRELSFFLSFAEFDSISDCLMMFHSEFSEHVERAKLYQRIGIRLMILFDEIRPTCSLVLFLFVFLFGFF